MTSRTGSAGACAAARRRPSAVGAGVAWSWSWSSSSDEAATPPPTTIPVGGTLRIGRCRPGGGHRSRPARWSPIAGSVMVDDLLWVAAHRHRSRPPSVPVPVAGRVLGGVGRPHPVHASDSAPTPSSPTAPSITSTDVAAIPGRVAAWVAASLASGPLSDGAGLRRGAVGRPLRRHHPRPVHRRHPAHRAGRRPADLLSRTGLRGGARRGRPGRTSGLLPGPTSGPYAVDAPDPQAGASPWARANDPGRPAPAPTWSRSDAVRHRGRSPLLPTAPGSLDLLPMPRRSDRASWSAPASAWW